VLAEGAGRVFSLAVEVRARLHEGESGPRPNVELDLQELLGVAEVEELRDRLAVTSSDAVTETSIQRVHLLERCLGVGRHEELEVDLENEREDQDLVARWCGSACSQLGHAVD